MIPLQTNINLNCRVVNLELKIRAGHLNIGNGSQSKQLRGEPPQLHQTFYLNLTKCMLSVGLENKQ